LDLGFNPVPNRRCRRASQCFFVKHVEGLVQVLSRQIEIPHVGCGFRNTGHPDLLCKRTVRGAGIVTSDMIPGAMNGGWRTLPHHLDARIGFSGCPILRAFGSCEGWGFRRTSRRPFRRTPTSRAAPTMKRLSAHAEKTCTEPVCRNWYRFGASSASLHQFCPVEQLFSARLRATFERQLKYETVHRIVHPESLPAEADLPA
jgi:hypothetical protein